MQCTLLTGSVSETSAIWNAFVNGGSEHCTFTTQAPLSKPLQVSTVYSSQFSLNTGKVEKRRVVPRAVCTDGELNFVQRAADQSRIWLNGGNVLRR